MNRIVTNSFPTPEDQKLGADHKRPSKLRLSDINWRNVGIFIVLILLFPIAWAVIGGISGLGSGFGSIVMSWFRDASINPENRRGFEYFLRLLMTAGFIGLLLAFLKRR